MSLNLNIDKIKDSLSIIHSYIYKINEEFLKSNITGRINKCNVTYRDPTRDWFSKDFVPQLNVETQSLLKTDDKTMHLYINDTTIRDNYIYNLLESYRICTSDEPYDQVEDNKRLNELISKWKIEIPSTYDKDEHLRRLIWDISSYLYVDDESRNKIKSLVDVILSPDKNLHLDEFHSNGMVFKVIDFGGKLVELKAIEGLFGEYAYYCKSDPVLPNSQTVKIPQTVYHPCCVRYTVRSLSKGLFDNLTKTETIILPVSIEKCEWSFWNCKKLKEIKLDGFGWYMETNDGVLYDRGHKTLFAYPNCHGSEFHVLDGVVNIDNCSFKDCNNIKKLFLPQSIKHIGLNAFYRCYNLETIICDFNEKDIVFEGYFGDYGNICPLWIFKDGSTNNNKLA